MYVAATNAAWRNRALYDRRGRTYGTGGLTYQCWKDRFGSVW
jgi:hypothetical protein